jgi:hypothetical protein
VRRYHARARVAVCPSRVLGRTNRLHSRSDRTVLLRAASRSSGAEFPIALLNAARPPVLGDGGANVIRASTSACRRDFLLRLAGCQRKDLITEAGRTTFTASALCGRSALVPTCRR